MIDVAGAICYEISQAMRAAGAKGFTVVALPNSIVLSWGLGKPKATITMNNPHWHLALYEVGSYPSQTPKHQRAALTLCGTHIIDLTIADWDKIIAAMVDHLLGKLVRLPTGWEPYSVDHPTLNLVVK